MNSHDSPILLVEDNEDDVFFMRRSAKTAEIRNPIQVSSNGQEAIDYLGGAGKFADRKEFPMPCVVLLDLKLPFKNGFEVLEWIRSKPELKNLVVIMLTTSREGADIKKAYALGANAYLVKPAAEGLVRMTTAIKNFWLDINESCPL